MLLIICQWVKKTVRLLFQLQECYTEHEVYAPADVNFNLGCVPTAMCSVLSTDSATGTLVDREAERSTRPIQLCYECCDSNGCNHHACKDTVGNLAG